MTKRQTFLVQIISNEPLTLDGVFYPTGYVFYEEEKTNLVEINTNDFIGKSQFSVHITNTVNQTKMVIDY